MPDVLDSLESVREFLEAQHLFFVATAPSAGGHINLSPKGLDSFRVLDAHTAVYFDRVGSGAETIAHVKENGRIVLMFCAFSGPPRIVRLHGHGEILEPRDAEFRQLRSLFTAGIEGRSIVRIRVDRVSQSCGFGVPLMSFEADRSQLPAWEAKKGVDGLQEYQAAKNRVSIDGLPALKIND